MRTLADAIADCAAANSTLYFLPKIEELSVGELWEDSATAARFLAEQSETNGAIACSLASNS